MNSNALEAILNVAIGMIFMWLILSVATMSIQEWIASYLKWRAKDLETAIQRLLGDKTWAEQLYNYPLIESLSKKPGSKPSYIPANKFALALYDVVMTAGTQESFIQQMLLSANRELNKAPSQIGPFLLYVFKRFGTNIQKAVYRFIFLIGFNVGTPDQKYDEILALTQKLIHSNDPEQSEDLAKGLKEFFKNLLNDTTIAKGKTVSLPGADFLRAYPVFRNYFFELLKVAMKNQSILALRWSEIMVYNNKKLVKALQEKLEPGETLREKLREHAKNLAKDFKIEEQDLESVTLAVRQTLDEIDFAPMVAYIQGLIGSSTHGLAALQTLNPSLHKSLQQLYSDIVGVANNTQMVDSVRAVFANAALNANKVEYNLQAMRLNSETWFNESMDRLSGWYKRKATLLAFSIGLVLAAILNVDSIELVQHLWKEPAVREALAANATEFTKANTELPTVTIEDNQVGDAVTFFNEQFKGLNIPLGWTYEPVTIGAGQTCRIIPIGQNVIWGIKEQYTPDQCQKISNAPVDSAGWSLKIMGIIFSAAAAAQGSPFWFDILKKLVNIRGSGRNPDEKAK